MRFSSRLPEDLSPNPLAALHEELRARGVPILDLTESNPTRVGLGWPDERVLSALADPAARVYAPDPRGLPAAREAVSGWYAERGAAVPMGRVFLTASTSEAYGWLFKLLCDPGDRVLVPQPSYPLFDLLAALERVELLPYPIRYDGRWHLDLPALEEAARGERVRAIVVVHPNNPTGSFLKRDELRALLAIGRDLGLALIADEVFADYAWGPDPARAPTVAGGEEALVFSLGGLSKAAALPQLKLGWIAVSGAPPAREEAVRRLELIADTYLSVNAPVQHAAPRLLDRAREARERIAARLRANREALAAALAAVPACRLLHAEGGWYAVVEIPETIDEEDLALDLLARDHLLVHPGYFFDFPSGAHLVLSLLPAPDRFAAGAARLAARLGDRVEGDGGEAG